MIAVNAALGFGVLGQWPSRQIEAAKLLAPR
jgi:hypothetical protein